MEGLLRTKPLKAGLTFNTEFSARYTATKNERLENQAEKSLRDGQDRANKELQKSTKGNENNISAPDPGPHISAEEQLRINENISKLSELEKRAQDGPLATDYQDLLKKYQKEQRPGMAMHLKDCQILDKTFNDLKREVNFTLKTSLESNVLEFRQELSPDLNKSVIEAWKAAELADRNIADNNIDVYSKRTDVRKAQSLNKHTINFDEWLGKQTATNPDLENISLIALSIENAKKVVDEDTGRAKSFYEPNRLLSGNYKDQFDGTVGVHPELAKSMVTRVENNCVVYSQLEPSVSNQIANSIIEKNECQKNGETWIDKPLKSGNRDAIRDEGNIITVETSGAYNNSEAINDAAYLAHQKWGFVRVDANAPDDFHIAMAKCCAEFSYELQTKHPEFTRYFEDICDQQKIEKLTKHNPLEVDQITRDVEEARRVNRENELKVIQERQKSIDKDVDFIKYKALQKEFPERGISELNDQIKKERNDLNVEINGGLKKKEVLTTEDRALTNSEVDYIASQSRLHGRDVSMEELDKREKDRKMDKGEADRKSLVPELTTEELEENFDMRARENSAKAEYDLRQNSKQIERN